MSTYKTSNFGLSLWSSDDKVRLSEVNQNLRIIDTGLVEGGASIEGGSSSGGSSGKKENGVHLPGELVLISKNEQTIPDGCVPMNDQYYSISEPGVYDSIGTYCGVKIETPNTLEFAVSSDNLTLYNSSKHGIYTCWEVAAINTKSQLVYIVPYYSNRGGGETELWTCIKVFSLSTMQEVYCKEFTCTYSSTDGRPLNSSQPYTRVYAIDDAVCVDWFVCQLSSQNNPLRKGFACIDITADEPEWVDFVTAFQTEYISSEYTASLQLSGTGAQYGHHLMAASSDCIYVGYYAMGWNSMMTYPYFYWGYLISYDRKSKKRIASKCLPQKYGPSDDVIVNLASTESDFVIAQSTNNGRAFKIDKDLNSSLLSNLKLFWHNNYSNNIADYIPIMHANKLYYHAPISTSTSSSTPHEEYFKCYDIETDMISNLSYPSTAYASGSAIASYRAINYPTNNLSIGAISHLAAWAAKPGETVKNGNSDAISIFVILNNGRFSPVEYVGGRAWTTSAPDTNSYPEIMAEDTVNQKIYVARRYIGAKETVLLDWGSTDYQLLLANPIKSTEYNVYLRTNQAGTVEKPKELKLRTNIRLITDPHQFSMTQNDNSNSTITPNGKYLVTVQCNRQYSSDTPTCGLRVINLETFTEQSVSFVAINSNTQYYLCGADNDVILVDVHYGESGVNMLAYSITDTGGLEKITLTSQPSSYTWYCVPFRHVNFTDPRYLYIVGHDSSGREYLYRYEKASKTVTSVSSSVPHQTQTTSNRSNFYQYGQFPDGIVVGWGSDNDASGTAHHLEVYSHEYEKKFDYTVSATYGMIDNDSWVYNPDNGHFYISSHNNAVNPNTRYCLEFDPNNGKLVEAVQVDATSWTRYLYRNGKSFNSVMDNSHANLITKERYTHLTATTDSLSLIYTRNGDIGTGFTVNWNPGIYWGGMFDDGKWAIVIPSSSTSNYSYMLIGPYKKIGIPMMIEDEIEAE